jgi:Flp pilus assembly pilin Flp
MLNAVKSFIRDEEGMEMVEWAIVAALIVGTAVGSLNTLGPAIIARYLEIIVMVNP